MCDGETAARLLSAGLAEGSLEFWSVRHRTPRAVHVPQTMTVPQGRVVTDCEDEIELGRVGAGELGPALGAQTADIEAELAQQVKRVGMHLALGMAPGRVRAKNAASRAIENGFSLVRQTEWGLAMTVDYEGHVLAASDFFTSDPQVMVAYVPMQGVHTIYATIGDLFAWLSMAGLVVLIGVAIVRRRKAGEAGAAEPSEGPLHVS